MRPMDGVKVCRKCKLSLPLDSFCKSKNRADGLNLRCRECVSAGRYPGKHTRKWGPEHVAYYRAKLADPNYIDELLDDAGLDGLASGLSQIG